MDEGCTQFLDAVLALSGKTTTEGLVKPTLPITDFGTTLKRPFNLPWPQFPPCEVNEAMNLLHYFYCCGGYFDCQLVDLDLSRRNTWMHEGVSRDAELKTGDPPECGGHYSMGWSSGLDEKGKEKKGFRFRQKFKGQLSTSAHPCFLTSDAG